MSLEQIDIMVLTETHMVSLPNSCQVVVLEQTGLASRAGIAIIAKSGAGWEVPHREVLIPGHVVIVNVNHRISRESFWVLGVYGDISQGQVSLSRFMERLRNRLTAFVRRQAHTHWGGCFTMGDWNFVEHTGDRHPNYGSLTMLKKILACFKSIKKLCAMKDALGRGPVPTAWTYSKVTQSSIVYS